MDKGYVIRNRSASGLAYNDGRIMKIAERIVCLTVFTENALNRNGV
jgi:hypothetical protein